MLFWIFFILFLFLCFAPISIGGIANSRLRYLVGVIFLLFVTVFRFDVGFDYSGYYYNMYPFFDEESYQRLEPAGQLFMVISDFYRYPQIFFIFYGVITIVCFSIAFKKLSKNQFISFLFYIACYYLPGLSTVRQEAAVSIVLLGYVFIHERKFIYYLSVCLIASLFHTTAIVCILFYPFFRIKSITKSILITFIIILCLVLALDVALSFPVFSAYYHYMEDSDTFKGGSIMRYFYLLITFIVLGISYKKKDLSSFRFSLLALVGCFLTLILGGHIGGRIAEYFTIFLCIALANVLQAYGKKFILSVGLSLSVLFMANIYISTKNPTKKPYTPYQTIFLIDSKNPRFK